MIIHCNIPASRLLPDASPFLLRGSIRLISQFAHEPGGGCEPEMHAEVITVITSIFIIKTKEYICIASS